jgi:hypothetical protein
VQYDAWSYNKKRYQNIETRVMMELEMEFCNFKQRRIIADHQELGNHKDGSTPSTHNRDQREAILVMNFCPPKL